MWVSAVRLAVDCWQYLEASASCLSGNDECYGPILPNEEDWWRMTVEPFLIACAEMEGYHSSVLYR